MRKLLNEELGRKSVSDFRASEKTPIVVVLDNVRSLNNVGSIFRTCDAFLIEELYLCGITGCPPHAEIHKTALGAESTVAWKYFEDTLGAINYLKDKGYIAVSIEQTTDSISLGAFMVEANQKYALVFGNEIKGVRQEVVDACTSRVDIPQFGTKHSFNVSVTTGIVLWEFYRQLAKKKQA